MSKAVEIRDLKWQYNSAEEPMALKGISLSFEEGEFIGVCGPNESGKTTLVSAIKGLIPHKLNGVYTGEVLLFGNDVRKIHLYFVAAAYTLCVDIEYIFCRIWIYLERFAVVVRIGERLFVTCLYSAISRRLRFCRIWCRRIW